MTIAGEKQRSFLRVSLCLQVITVTKINRYAGGVLNESDKHLPNENARNCRRRVLGSPCADPSAQAQVFVGEREERFMRFDSVWIWASEGERFLGSSERHAAAQGQPERVPEDALADEYNL